MVKRVVWALALSGVLFASPAFAAHIVYATNVEQYTGVVADPLRNDPNEALGAPDSTLADPFNFVSLGLGGILTVSFGSQFATEATVWEVTFNCSAQAGNPLLCVHGEQAEVYTSFTDDTFGGGGAEDFTFQGLAVNLLAQFGQTIALTGGPFRYLTLVDKSAGLGSSDGFDVDAVAVQHVPEPSSFALLGLGLVGMGLARRRTEA